MTRKMLTATLLVAAMLLSVLSLGGFTNTAQADDYSVGAGALCGYDAFVAGAVTCADAIAYPGPFTNMPTTPGGPYGWGTLQPAYTADAAAAAATTAAGGTGGGLAVTGNESAVLAYAGAGLIAFGAVALGSRRKFFQGALED